MRNFANAIICWQKQFGRHDLPWQNTTDPYAIWVSEIMLQQTQVSAVIGYYAKFMMCFSNIHALANATQDEVLQHWSGLGYYSRARNLHNAAQKIVDDFGGEFPQDFDAILSLPGIGRSTAAAISTFAFNRPQPILDGNVKRVFARHFLVEGWPGTPKIEQKMWQIALRENPTNDAIAYTQGLMDLGATLCSRSKPKCKECPVNSSCVAFAQNLTQKLPTTKPRKTLPEKNITMLVMMSGNEVMLEKRPPSGIWGGLWSFPETEITAKDAQILPKLTHSFTHFKLHIQPQLVQTNKKNHAIEPRTVWLSLDDAIGAAIPTPVRKILLNLKEGIRKI
ncbi:MAG: A/G-specific adenine glycosylase [Methylophilaceae bacterium]